ncbi:hypothetical protein TNCV_1908031 [Trichonephila clavipes]|nr:hypothetical protein TNCV_1908031 [Trichonephila clavipes]
MHVVRMLFALEDQVTSSSNDLAPCLTFFGRFSHDRGSQHDLGPTERQCFQITIFMQDGATPHIGCQVKALLSANFGDKCDYPDVFRMHGLLVHPT